MERFSITTEKSLYKPIEIEVNGKLYIIDKISPKLLREVAKYDSPATRGDADAIVAQFSLLTKVDKAIVEELDVRDLSAALAMITTQIFRPEKLGEKEKKVSTPGAKA
ncbi:hypothetical protein KKF82_04350 [Patescibacteria group bacterium]|nr:hypothetical protein [Patescibacteria group bacterium]